MFFLLPKQIFRPKQYKIQYYTILSTDIFNSHKFYLIRHALSPCQVAVHYAKMWVLKPHWPQVLMQQWAPICPYIIIDGTMNNPPHKGRISFQSNVYLFIILHISAIPIFSLYHVIHIIEDGKFTYSSPCQVWFVCAFLMCVIRNKME